MSWVQDIFIGETLQEQKPHEVGEFVFLKDRFNIFFKEYSDYKMQVGFQKNTLDLSL